MDLIIFSVFYNRETEVKPSVESLLVAAPKNSKIILVDDGSKDDTHKNLKRFNNDERVKIISQKNMGFSKTLSVLIPKILQKSKCNYIGIHGAGDKCDKDKFKKQLDYMNNNKDIVALGCGHRTLIRRNNKKIHEDKGFIEADVNSLYRGVPFTHGTVIYRTKAFMEAGGYNGIFEYCQDWEFYFRLIKLGRIVRYPEVLYTKYIFNDGASVNPYKRAKQIRYKNIILSQKKSEDIFNNNIHYLQDKGLDSSSKDPNLLKEYRKSQMSLLKKGEFELAVHWSNIIYNETNNKKELYLKTFIKILGKLKFPSLTVFYLYKIYIFLKKRGNK